MTCPWKLKLIPVLAASLVLGRVMPARAGAWRPLPPIPTEYPSGVHDFVLDTQGTPWAAAHRDVYRFDGRQWLPVAEGHAPYAAGRCLHGGADRGAYLSANGRVFRLEAGRAEQVADMPAKPVGDYPRWYVSRSGRLFHCGNERGKDSLSVLVDGQWKSVKVELDITDYAGHIIDFSPDGPVVFLARNAPKAVLWDDETFDTDVALPELKVDHYGNVRAGRWGKNRILFWHIRSELLGAVELVGHRFEPVDVGPVAEKIGEGRSVYIADTAPDGALWLRLSRPHVGGHNLVRIGDDGKTAKYNILFIKWGTDPCPRYYDDGALHARDATFWFAGHKRGLSAVRDGKVELYDWHEGVLATDVSHLAEAPDGTLYAAASNASHQVYRWDPEAEPDRSLTREWEEIVHLFRWKSAADPFGNLWVFRRDRPGKVSRWDGTAWRDFDVPFDPDKLNYKLADDRGHLIVQMHPHDRTPLVHVVGPQGVRDYATLKQALVDRVEAGARRFCTPAPDLVGPVVTDDGQIWLAQAPYYKERDLFAYLDGQWHTMDLKGVSAMGPAGKNRMVFITKEGMWTYRSGSLVKLADVPDRSTFAPLTVKGEFGRHNGFVPFIPGMPESLRERYTVMRQVENTRYVPIRWEQTENIGDENTGVRGINDPRTAIPAPGGGAWIPEGNSTVWRWLDELLVKLNPENTPLVDRPWSHVGVTPSGGVWIVSSDYHAGTRIFLRKARQESELPKVRLKRVELQYGRRVRVEWDLPKEGISAAVWRAGAHEPWRILDGQVCQRLFTKPGKHRLQLEARAVDELGLLGPATKHTVEVDVRLPRTRWTARLPNCLEDLVWVVPVAADWTDPDVPRRIEWRLAGDDWRLLPENKRIPVARHNNRAVEFQFRAVEEDIFSDPNPLSIKVAVEMPLEEVIRRRIELLCSGTEAERKQAIKDLKAAPEDARRLLRARLNSLVQAESACRQALTEIQ